VTDFLDTFLNDYFAEAEEHLAAIRRALLMLEHSVGQRRIDGGIVEELFRSFHSLKGIAGMVDHRETESLAHELESYLRALRDGEALLTTAGMDLLIKGAGTLEASIAARRANEAPRDTAAIVDEIQALIDRDGGDAAEPGADAARRRGNWRCIFTPSPSLIARGVNVDVIRARLREHGEIV
jgi:two-component system, chemotaxis family, sensor kinase CheA